MNELLSIKSEFVNKILSHEKLYEFRMSIFTQEVGRIYIYSTYPVKKIVGYFEVTEIICKSPNCLWNLFSDVVGICENDFFKYYSNSEERFAIKIDNLEVFDDFIDMGNFEDFRAPQSFCYIENNYC